MDNSSTPQSSRIELNSNDPWSNEYWAKHDVLVSAFRKMAYGSLSSYADWWLRYRSGTSLKSGLRMASCYYNMMQNIKKDGYQEDKWKEDPRKFEERQGPIAVNILDDGTLSPYDGMHRSCMLKSLDMSVPTVAYSSTIWQEFKDTHQYGYCPHPDLVDINFTRHNDDRYRAIVKRVSEFSLTPNVLDIGSNVGRMPWFLHQAGFNVVAVESNKIYFRVLRALAGKTGFIAKLNSAEKFEYSCYNVCIGLSVYHHVATSIEQWAKVCKLLSKSPAHIIELPTDKENRWHDDFKQGKSELLLQMLCDEGGYKNREIIYTDPQYANRQTVLYSR